MTLMCFNILIWNLFLLLLQHQLIKRSDFLMYLIECFVTVLSVVVMFAFNHLLNILIAVIAKLLQPHKEQYYKYY